MLRAAVFDMDGTLGDTLPLCIESFRLAVRDLDGRMLEDGDISRHFGPSDLGVLQRLFPDRPDLVLPGMELMLRYYKELHADMAPAPFDGAAELLDELRKKGIILAMVTGKCMETAIVTLEQFGLREFFPMVEPGSPRKVVKGEALLRIADHYALRAHEMLYMGDSVSDAVACREAGVPFVGAAWAETGDEEALKMQEPAHLFTNFVEFSNFIISQASR